MIAGFGWTAQADWTMAIWTVQLALTRLAFIGLDGTPRSIPIGFVWNGSEIVMYTAKNARGYPRCAATPRSP